MTSDHESPSTTTTAVPPTDRPHSAMPQPFAAIGRKYGQVSDSMRRHTLDWTPNIVLKHPTLAISAMHVGTEIAMFKASGVTFLKNNREPGGRVNLLIDPPRNLFRALSGADNKKLLQNPWSARATMTGFTGWTVGMAVADPKEGVSHRPERPDADAPLAAKAQYGLHQAWRGLHIFSPDCKREVIGLATFGAGVFSALSGLKNVNLQREEHFKNVSQTIGGLITAWSGVPLLLESDDRKAWHDFGTHLRWRLPFAFGTTIQKWHRNDRWKSYAMGQVGFQGAAFFSSVFGGTEHAPPVAEEKSPPGTQVVQAEHLRPLAAPERNLS